VELASEGWLCFNDGYLIARSSTMQINHSLLSAGLGAYQAGQQRIDQAGAAIAEQTLPAVGNSQALADTVELTEQLVQMKVGEHAANAGVRMLQTADEVLGTLVNTKA
jgi:hypothetical protein